MIRLTVNVFPAAIILLKRLSHSTFSSITQLIYKDSKITSISTEDIFTFSECCGWVCENGDIPKLTERGYILLDLVEKDESVKLKRAMLRDFVMKTSPIWTSRIPYGRQETVIYMSADEKACFFEAGLLSEQIDPDGIIWWDTIAEYIRSQRQRENVDTGRLGEQSTVAYEKSRTSFEPKWIALDSNLVGYDVLSRLSSDNPDALLIEVKSSSKPLDQAVFHVTAHEWGMALASTSYIFHLWCFYERKKLLAVIPSNEVLPFIPTNNLVGEWESVKIPFSCFEDKFIEIA